MSSSTSILKNIQHYQRSIEKTPTDVSRLLRCVGKLNKIPITVEQLQQTGVGRTVNALRKHEGELGEAAEELVNKWKELVTVENDIYVGNQSFENKQDVDENKNSQNHVQPDFPEETSQKYSQSHFSKVKTQQNRSKQCTKMLTGEIKNHYKSLSSSHKSNRHSQSRHKSEQRDKSKGHHSTKDSNKEKKREHSSSSIHKNEARERTKNDKKKHKSDKKHYITSKGKVELHQRSHDKYKNHEKLQSTGDKEKSKPLSLSSSSRYEQKSYQLTPKKGKIRETDPCLYNDDETSALNKMKQSGNKRRHVDEDDEKKEKGISLKTSKSSSQNKQKSDKSETSATEMDDGIDSSMGANFADVLDMLNMPRKKVRKSLNELKTSLSKSLKKLSDDCDSPDCSSSLKINGMQNTEKPPTSSSPKSTHTAQQKWEKKPEWLTSKFKLPPLVPSIALELPVISNNYLPEPLSSTVMDCVFNSTTSRAPPPPPRLFSNTLDYGISSKKMRTKVYSGVKRGKLMQVPSLFDLCTRFLQRNIDALEYTGGIPFDILRGVLERATPQQLLNIEEYNPYMMEDSDILWQQHVQRNHKGHKREEMETWREMFMRCEEEQELRLSMLTEIIKQSQKAIALPVRKTQLAFVDSLVKPPRNVVRKQERYGTTSKIVATPAARVAALCDITPNAAKQGDARLRVAAALRQNPAKMYGAPKSNKKAPLMAKTLKFMRGHSKR